MIDFWVSIGSTYSYLTVSRLKSVEEATGVSFRWRPFSVRAIMIEQKNIPFVGKPVKMAYMWRDIERRARNYGFEPKLPAPYPLQEFDLANRIAILAASEGWCANYALSAYRAWFHSGEEPGSETGVSLALKEVGQDRDRVLERARAEDIGEKYREATEEAKARGVFGSPTFVIDGEVFWGDDRLEDAIRWRRAGRK